MFERDLAHTTPAGLASHPQATPGELRVIIPVASLSSAETEQVLGADLARVEAVAAGARAELNSSAPEVATWYSTPTWWLGSAAGGKAGEIGVGQTLFHQALTAVIARTLEFAGQVIVLCSTREAAAVREVVSQLRATGASVVWRAVEPGPDAAWESYEAIIRGRADASGELS